MQFASVGAIRGSGGWWILLIAPPLWRWEGGGEGEGGEEEEEEGYRGCCCCCNGIRHLVEEERLCFGLFVCMCFLISSGVSLIIRASSFLLLL